MATLPERIFTLFETFHLRPEKVIDELEPLYAADMRFVDPFQDVSGREAFLHMNRNLVRHLKEVRYEGLSLVGDGSHFMVSWTGTLRARIGPPVVLVGVSEFRARDGRIVYQRDYWDALSSLAGSFPTVGALYRRVTERLLA
jgi:steroid Delta-isomerase